MKETLLSINRLGGDNARRSMSPQGEIKDCKILKLTKY